MGKSFLQFMNASCFWIPNKYFAKGLPKIRKEVDFYFLSSSIKVLYAINCTYYVCNRRNGWLGWKWYSGLFCFSFEKEFHQHIIHHEMELQKLQSENPDTVLQWKENTVKKGTTCRVIITVMCDESHALWEEYKTPF